MACKLLYICLAAITCLPTLSAASSSRLSSSPDTNGSLPRYGSLPQHSASQDLQPRADKPFYLRIAALGASISNGYLSTDGNGYRKHLRDQLRLEGWLVNMVGSIHTGTMEDNSNEGHIGWKIDEVTNSAVQNIVSEQPNLVLINVGTNNAAQNVNVSTISKDYIRLLDKLWLGISNATVILSTLLVNKNAQTNTRANTINAAIRSTVLSHYAGKKIVLAEMNNGFITTADFADETHPNDHGYKKMASVWWTAFQIAEHNEWLTAPPDMGIPDGPTNDYLCIDGKGNLLASGNKGGNPPVFRSIGIIGKAPAFWRDGYTVDTVRMADIDGDGHAVWCTLFHPGDIACWGDRGPGDAPAVEHRGFWEAFEVVGQASTTVFKSQHGGNGRGVNLIDINGDFGTGWLLYGQYGQS
ncbi:hypothetical protein V500_06461 [Pseudogymnoascus sp. VKM F-4518 (FW-2643)]|nr:hypothetical protein V500_06461 [Pseudogymnoascus sp. VKM F-4518 (FW-2643)]